MNFAQYQIDHFQEVLDDLMKEEQQAYIVAESARNSIADYLVTELDWVESAKSFRSSAGTLCVSLVPNQAAIDNLDREFEEDADWIESKYVSLQSIIDKVVLGSYTLADYLRDAQ